MAQHGDEGLFGIGGLRNRLSGTNPLAPPSSSPQTGLLSGGATPAAGTPRDPDAEALAGLADAERREAEREAPFIEAKLRSISDINRRIGQVLRSGNERQLPRWKMWGMTLADRRMIRAQRDHRIRQESLQLLDDLARETASLNRVREPGLEVLDFRKGLTSQMFARDAVVRREATIQTSEDAGVKFTPASRRSFIESGGTLVSERPLSAKEINDEIGITQDIESMQDVKKHLRLRNATPEMIHIVEANWEAKFKEREQARIAGNLDEILARQKLQKARMAEYDAEILSWRKTNPDTFHLWKWIAEGAVVMKADGITPERNDFNEIIRTTGEYRLEMPIRQQFLLAAPLVGGTYEELTQLWPSLFPGRDAVSGVIEESEFGSRNQPQLGQGFITPAEAKLRARETEARLENSKKSK